MPIFPHPLPPIPDQRPARSSPPSLRIGLDPQHNRHLHAYLGDPAAPPVETDRAAKPVVTTPSPADLTPTRSKQGNGGAGVARRRR